MEVDLWGCVIPFLVRRILNFVPLSPPKANTIFLAQTFFLGDTRPQRTRSVGRGRSKCPSYHPSTPYTLSPLLKGGEGRGEGGAYTHVACPFGALLVTLSQRPS